VDSLTWLALASALAGNLTAIGLGIFLAERALGWR